MKDNDDAQEVIAKMHGTLPAFMLLLALAFTGLVLISYVHHWLGWPLWTWWIPVGIVVFAVLVIAEKINKLAR